MQKSNSPKQPLACLAYDPAELTGPLKTRTNDALDAIKSPSDINSAKIEFVMRARYREPAHNRYACPHNAAHETPQKLRVTSLLLCTCIQGYVWEDSGVTE